VRGIAPDGVFGSYGDILSLKAEDVQLNVGGQAQTRRALFAEIKPLPSLVSLTGAGQKLFTSIEINPNFAGTGKAYLAGIAVTDNPASLGTEMLAFCAGQGAASPLASRKHAEGNLFTAAEPVEMNFADASIPVQDNTGILGLLRAMFNFSVQGNTGPSPVAEQVRPASPRSAMAGPRRRLPVVTIRPSPPSVRRSSPWPSSTGTRWSSSQADSRPRMRPSPRFRRSWRTRPRTPSPSAPARPAPTTWSAPTADRLIDQPFPHFPKDFP
jgi:hypothetical protein